MKYASSMIRTCLAAILLVVFLTVPLCKGYPVVQSAQYKEKHGEVQRASLTVLEYDVQFDQDIYLLKSRNCPVYPSCTVATPTCAPCNYASITNCGESASGCPPCPRKAELCPSDVAERTWAEVPVDESRYSDQNLIELGSTLSFRWYIPPEKACSGFEFELASRSGDPDVSTVTNLNSNTSSSKWFSLNSGSDVVTVCPTDVEFDVGTFEAQVYGYLQALSSARVVTYPTLSTSGPAIPCNLTAAHTCLQSDIEEMRPLPEISDSETYYYAVPLTGPCPRRVGLWQQIVDSEDYFLMSVSTVHPFPDPNNDTQSAELIIFEDFTTHFIALSYCPADLSKPTMVYISLERQSLSATSLLLRATTTSSNFLVAPLNQAANSSYDMGHIMLQHLMMRLGDSIFMPCDRFYGGSYCTVPGFENAQGIFAPIPAYNVTNILNPPWPWLWVTKRSGAIVDGTTATPTEIPRAFNRRKFAFSMIVEAELVQDGVAQQEVFVSEDDYENLQFKFRPQLVDIDGQPIAQGSQDGWLNATALLLPCLPQEFFRVKSLIDSSLTQLDNSSLLTTNTDALLSRLDVLNFLDAWIGCQASTESLIETNTEVVLLPNSTLCTPELTAAGDPCCSLDGLWTSCCVPRDVNVTVTRWVRVQEAAVSSRCGESRRTCINQFLLDYSADKASKNNIIVGCSGAVVQRDSFFRASNTFWKECMDSVLGEDLSGIDCANDSDCTAAGALRCNMNTLKCSFDRSTLAKHFLQCFVQQADPFILAYIRETLPQTAGVADDSLPDILFLTLQQNDCLPPVNVDATISRSYRWTSNGCEFGCDPDPLCLYTLCSIPVGCMWAGFPSLFCPRDPYWVFQNTSAEECAAITRCNDMSSADCAAGAFCGVCEDDGSCWPLPGIANEAQCNATWACGSASSPHSYTTATNSAACANQFSCTLPCWDGAKEVACSSPSQCQSAGSCSDFDELLQWFTSDTDPEGACVLPVSAFYLGGDCEATYSIPNRFTSPLGCVNTSASQSECAGLGGTWTTRARSSSACAAHGTGCLQPTPIDAPSALQPQFLSPKSQNDCLACGYQPQTYFEWTSARWIAATARKPRWIQKTRVAAGTWTTGFAYDQLGAILDEAVSRRYDIQVRAEQSCRFSRPMQDIAGIACSCEDNTATIRNSTISKASSDKCIADELTLDLTIGVSQPCGGATTVATALPFEVRFDPSSVPEGLCTTVKLEVVSKFEHRFVKPAQVASTFIPSVTRSTFEFSNSKKGIIGELAADGVEMVLDPNQVPTNFTLCVQGVSPVSQRYPVRDFAVVTPKGRIIPLELPPVLSFDSSKACSFFAAAPLQLAGSNSSFSVFPVNRVANWRTKSYDRFSKGEQALLIIAGVWYFVAVGFCCYGVYHIIFRSKRFTYQPQIVWPVIVLCLVRAIYCFLLAGNQLTSERITAGEFFLTDFPLNLYISVMQYLVLYWTLVVLTKVNVFAPIAIAFNVILYAMFLAVLLMMHYLPYSSADVNRLACQFEGDRYWTNRRILNVTYKIILGLICIAIGGAFTVFGRQIYNWLRKVETARKHFNGQQQTEWYQFSNSAKLLFLAILSTLSLMALCAFLLLLTAVKWRSTVFGVLFLSAIELLPLMTLIFLIIGNREEAVSTSASDTTASGTAAGSTSGGTSINAWTGTEDDL